jgi:type VI secretion system protein ImpA
MAIVPIETLLEPIPGQNPSGENIRYDPVFDAIREARREEEALSTGVWSREIKKANFQKVIDLTSAALKSRSKDLQLAAWLTEALLVTEGLPGLGRGLGLIQSLIEKYWDTLYPEIEDNDLEMRVGSIEWVATRLDLRIRRVPLTKRKLDWLKFEESRRIGYEADAAANDTKREARREAIEEKKCTAEEFDEDAKASGAPFYDKLTQEIIATNQSIDSLEAVCDGKFGGIAPSFATLRKAISDLQEVIQQYWQPTVPASEPEAPEEATSAEETTTETIEQTASSAPRRKAASVTEQPVDREDAFRRLGVISTFLRKEDPSNPASYLILRGAQWGELRRSGASPDLASVGAPRTETRQKIKKFSLEGQWVELAEEVECAMAAPWSRGWLDLQRHAFRAAESLGYSAVAVAIKSELASLLADLPGLTDATLADDTPAANPETQAWIREVVLPKSSETQEMLGCACSHFIQRA